MIGPCDNPAEYPDPPLFESREQNIELWLSRMRNKMNSNADHFPTDALKIDYVESRVGGEAALHLEPRMREDVTMKTHHTLDNLDGHQDGIDDWKTYPTP